ncbi:MAG: hypothetical protein KAT04_15790 [Methylococcales bacterium]|nr:hypothetical protein [Methylococcales bacterium]
MGGSVFAFIAAFQESYFSTHNGILAALFIVVLINLIVVVWSFNIPKKQYRQLRLDKADSINEILGIKDNK